MDGTSLLDRLAQELAVRGKALPTGTPALPYLHGPNGLWSYPGLSQAVISTRIKPRGLAGVLPARATNTSNPLYPYFTGFTDPAEAKPNTVCDDPPSTGQEKNCFQTAQFGRYSYQTREIDISNIGAIINRSEFTDLAFVNEPLGTAEYGAGLTWPGSAPGSLSLINDVRARFAALGVKFQNKLMRQLWEGNPANNTGGGGYQEFPGLDRLISTGKVDAVTNQTCPSLDSVVVNMNYKNVDVLTGNDTVINVLTYVFRVLRRRASGAGMDPAEWVIVMREGLFYELTAVWPCTYLTYRCMGFTNGLTPSVNIDAGDVQQMRDTMRNGRYLVIDGMQVPVIVDDALNEETSGDTNKVSATCFASDIKILPLMAGGLSTLFWEYFDFSGPGAAMDALASLPLGSNFFWSDGGQYLWHMKPPLNWCIQWLGLIRPRVILLTPHLAADIQNVQYCPLYHEQEAFPDDPYFKDGGLSSRTTAPSFYADWKV